MYTLLPVLATEFEPGNPNVNKGRAIVWLQPVTDDEYTAG